MKRILNYIEDSLACRDATTLWVMLPAVVIGLAAAFLPVYPFGQSYEQLIAGSITWEDKVKMSDYLSILVFFVVTLFTAMFIKRATADCAASGKDISGLACSLKDALLLSCIPFVIYVANAWSFSYPLKYRWIVLSALFIVIAILPVLKWRGEARKTLVPHYGSIVTGSSASMLFFMLSGIGIYAAALRLQYYDYGTLEKAGLLSGGLLILVGNALLITTWLASREPVTLAKRTRALLILSQIGLPMLFVLLMPVQPSDIELTAIQPSSSLRHLVVVLIAASYAFLAYYAAGPGKRTVPVTPLSMAALLVLIKMPEIGVPILSTDDYHFGEIYLPWTQFVQFDNVFFSGYDPARGMSQVLNGFVGSRLFDGTAAAISLSYTYIGILLLTIFSVVALWATDFKYAVIILLLVPFPEHHLINELIVVMMILFDKRLMNRTYLWMSVYVVLSIALVLYRPQTAPSVVLGAAVVGLYLFTRECRNKEYRKLLVWFLAMAVLIQSVNLLLPLNDMVLGVIRYIYDNAEVNTVANSIVFDDTFSANNKLVLHMSRLAILLFIVSLIVILLRKSTAETENPDGRLIVAGIMVMFLTMIPYAFGRAGTSVSRGPILAVYIASVFIPYLVYRLGANRGSLIAIYAAVMLTSVFMPMKGLVSGQYINDIDAELKVDGAKLLSGEDYGVPSYGAGYGNRSHLVEVSSIKYVMDRLLDEDETYLDLTNRNALYFYLDRKVPIDSGAVYNLPSLAQQHHSLDRIIDKPPPVVFAGYKSQRFDGGSVSIRSHLIYRFALDGYYPILVNDEFVFLLNEAKYRVFVGDLSDSIWTDPVVRFNLDRQGRDWRLQRSTKNNVTSIDVMNKVFHQKYLKKLPVAWGRNIENFISNDVVAEMARRPAAKYSITSSRNVLDQGVVEVFSAREGGRPDLMSAVVSCANSDDNYDFYITFDTLSNGVTMTGAYNIEIAGKYGQRLLVPLDASPSWLLSDTVKAVNFHASQTCSEIEVEDIRFYRRITRVI